MLSTTFWRTIAGRSKMIAKTTGTKNKATFISMPLEPQRSFAVPAPVGELP
ncbi:hypothetical protein [Sphingomonas crocodyli]|uniref:hypothetical protein n=1 Tax=Sphingomonas crocodyli TaxID=1979270 RepID=UPI0013E3F76A|nr:hypothetical protein [Sphingomonas crocodyli]